MKMKKYISLTLCLGLLAMLLAGCGGSSKQMSMAYDNAVMEEMAAEAPAAAMGSNSMESGSTTLPESRKWIVTMDLTAETDDLDAFTANLDDRIAALNGYIESQSIYNGSQYSSGRRYRSANLTIRIPADQVDTFTQDVDGIANIVRKNKDIQDITLSYVATESRLNALQTEEARLLELLAQAETMTDLLEIESRLTDVRYELENYASRLRLYDNQIDYATIYLDISEVQEYTPVEEPTLWERIRDGFTDSISGLGESLQDLLVFVIVAAPYVLVYGGILLALWAPAKKLRMKRKARKAAKKAAKEAAKQAEKKEE